MQDPLEAAGAVNGSGFIQAGIDGGHGGNVDDGVPSHFLPDIDHADQPPEVLSFAQEEDRLLRHSEGQDHLVDGAVAGKDVLRHANHDDHAQEMGQIGHGLDGPLEGPDADLVQQNRQQDGGNSAEDQVDDAHGQGVPDAVQEVLPSEKPFKVIPPDPGAVEQAQLGLIILKRRDPAPHGAVVEQQHIQENGHGHQHQLPLASQGTEEASLSDGNHSASGASLTDRRHTRFLLRMSYDLIQGRGREPVLSPCGY